jgi:hypothetical protein
MRTGWVLLWAAACSEPSTHLLDRAPPPGTAGLTMSGLSIVERGDVVTWEVTAPDLAIGVPVHLAWGGEVLQNGRCPHQGGLVGGWLCIDIGNPARLMDTVTTVEHPDFPGQGLARFTLTVPATPRTQIYLQAMSLDGADSATSQPFLVDLVRVDPPRVAPDCGTILVYTTEDRDDRANYLGWFDALVTDPALSDYEVTVRERLDHPTLEAADLVGFDQLWVMGTNRDVRPIFSQTEVDTIHQFLADGGGLLVAAEHGGGGQFTYTEDVNAIANYYGATFTGSRSPPTITDFEPVSLFDGVTTLPGVSESWIVYDNTTLTSVASYGGESVIAMGSDSQRIVLDRSWVPYGGGTINQYDARQYITNVADYLGNCTRN